MRMAAIVKPRRLAGHFYGTEDPGDMIPLWVEEAVVRGRLPNKPEDKCAFILQPAEVNCSMNHAASALCMWLRFPFCRCESYADHISQHFKRLLADSSGVTEECTYAQGSDLPPLVPARLNAPAIMRCQKIAPYTLVRVFS